MGKISKETINRPKVYRRSKNGNFVLEYYRLGCFLLSFGFGSFEIQINKWSKHG